MTIQQAYTQWSATYDHDRNRTRDLDAVVTHDVLGEVCVASVVEIGCGTGKNTALLAEIGERVTALDFSEGMVALARRKVRSDNVTFRTADLTNPWPCHARSADLIVCNLVLEHIEDVRFIFSEAARVLSDGGRFFVCEPHPARQYLGTKATFARDGAATEIPAFVHHLSDFLDAAEASRLTLLQLREWWHEEDENKPPRLVSFLFGKPGPPNPARVSGRGVASRE
jgi:malonyl-CoA O-methyltransferase